MTSKSSFLANLKENNKRRLWVWVLSALGFVLAFPVLVSVSVSQTLSNTGWIGDTYGQEAVAAILHERLLEVMRGQLGFFFLKMTAAAGIAIVSAIQGFSWLYSRKKIDFYMGMPVKRQKRFLIIWLNGILIYLIPAFVGVLIELLIAAVNGAVDGTVIASASAAFLVNLCFYLGVYHVTLLAVMLTGNVVITCFGTAVLFLYEYMVRWVLLAYKDFFFQYYSRFKESTTPFLSPFSFYFKLAGTFQEQSAIDIKNLAGLIIFALAVGALAYLCYLKRPAEAAGRAMTFPVTRGIIKILLVVPIALLAGALMAALVDYQPRFSDEGAGFVILAMMLAVVLGSGLIQVIYEFDIRGAVHRKRQLLISGVAVALIFVTFRYDLTGFDSWVPEPEEVESIAFVPEYYEQNMSGAYFDEQGNYLPAQEYAQRNMYLKNVETVCELARISIEKYDQIERDYYSAYEEEQWGKWSGATVLYRLKNGRQVCRDIMVNVDGEETVGLLDQIIGTDEFKRGYMMGASPQLKDMVSGDNHYKITASWGNMVYWEDMSRADAAELLEICQGDLQAANFTNVRDNIPEGMLRLVISEEIPGSKGRYSMYRNATRSWYINVNIYSFYENCIDFLKENGYYMDYQLNPEDVAYIQVMNNNTEKGRELSEKLAAQSLQAQGEAVAVDYDDTATDTRVYAEYTDREEIESIAALCYPQDFVESYSWDRGVSLDYDYRVYVYFNADSELTKAYGTSAEFGFREGQVPDFVAEDTAYRE